MGGVCRIEKVGYNWLVFKNTFGVRKVMLKSRNMFGNICWVGNEICGLATLASLSWGLPVTPSGVDLICWCGIILGTRSRTFVAQASYNVDIFAHVLVMGTKPTQS